MGHAEAVTGSSYTVGTDPLADEGSLGPTSGLRWVDVDLENLSS